MKSTIELSVSKSSFFPPLNRNNIYKLISLTYCSPKAPLSNVIIEEELEHLAIINLPHIIFMVLKYKMCINETGHSNWHVRTKENIFLNVAHSSP